MPRNKRPGGHNALQKSGAGGTAPGRNEVRIIGGAWRGRKIRFPPAAGLRPTPNRVRETLFNWLAPAIGGAHCLDLFAGSGALGLEALSRNAARVVFVESDLVVARHLAAVAGALAQSRAEVVGQDARRWLSGAPRGFEIAFVDPPFGAGLLDGALTALAQPGWLAPGAFVYIERAADGSELALPAGWRLHRSGRAGEVGYYLAVTPGVGPGSAGPSRDEASGERE